MPKAVADRLLILWRHFDYVLEYFAYPSAVPSAFPRRSRTPEDASIPKY
jgi:hypothetical protein